MWVTHTPLCQLQNKRPPVWCASVWQRFGMQLLQQMHEEHISTHGERRKIQKKCLKIRFRKKKKTIQKKRKNMVLVSRHAHIHVSNKKSTSQGSGLQLCTRFQSSPGWQAHCKSKCRFYDTVQSFLFELTSRLQLLSFLAKQQIETCWGLKGQSAKPWLKTDLRLAAADWSSN